MNAEKKRSEQALAEAIGASVLVHAFDEIDSTNNEAKRMVLAGIEGPALISANTQTAGRGRMGRSFYSPAQTGVYFSILYPCTHPLRGAVSITGAAAVAVMRAIRALTGKQTAIKWVNDLYLDGKKVCGILAEAVTVGVTTHLIVGIGINLRTQSFPAELDGKAGSLGVGEVSRTELIAAIWRELLPCLRDPSNRGWLADYRAHSYVIGKTITWTREGADHHGIAVGINDDGELTVEREDGQTDILRTGEISVRVRSEAK